MLEGIDYIAKNTQIDTITGCHNWTGPLTKDGYGQVGPERIFERYRIKGAHRLAYHLATGHDFAGRHEQVRHSCHTRRCCNPAHLSIGNALQNMADKPDTLPSRDVAIIRMLRAADVPAKWIAERFARTISYVQGVASGRCRPVLLEDYGVAEAEAAAQAMIAECRDLTAKLREQRA